MKVYEILNDCIFKLGMSDRISLTETGTYTDEQQKIINSLLRCANIVYAELCTNYFPNIVCEKVLFTDNKLNLSSLQNNRFVYAVTLRQNGILKRIKQYPSYIESNFSGDAVLEYVALPNPLTFLTEVSNVIPSWLYAEGIVSEYAFANNLIDIAAACERKFREGLGQLRARGAGKYVKARRWL